MATTEEMFKAHAGWNKSQALQYEEMASQAEGFNPETRKHWREHWLETAKRYHDNAEFYSQRAIMFAEPPKQEAKIIDLV